MYLFTRRVRLSHAAGVQWALDITTKVHQVTGQDVELWGTVYSPGYGTITWTAWFEDLPHLETFGDKLSADEGFQTMSAEGASFTDGGVDDGLLQLLGGTPDPDRDLHYVSSVQATCAGGNARRAMTLGLEISERAESITGVPMMFVRAMSGSYGGVGWLAGYEDIASLERAGDALAADDGFSELIDSTEGAFVEDPASTVQTIHRRLS
jgi:hypothetical protein